jgi:hypothetical protein
MGGRIAERSSSAWCPPAPTTTSSSATERARKMVREWGMSERIGPMAWGSQGQVFLGEDLMSTRDYSDDTARVIDEEVEKILRDCEQRASRSSPTHRNGLDLVARACSSTRRSRAPRFAAWSPWPPARSRSPRRRPPSRPPSPTADRPPAGQSPAASDEPIEPNESLTEFVAQRNKATRGRCRTTRAAHIT